MASQSKRFERQHGRKIQGNFLSVPFYVLDSRAFVALPPLARALYFDLRRQFKGEWNNGQMAATEGQLAKLGWPRSTVKKYLPLLLEHGLMEKTRQGGIASMSKICSLYRFTDCGVLARPDKGIDAGPATHDFKNWKPEENRPTPPPENNPKGHPVPS